MTQMESREASCRIIVFAKAPIPGEVKTRLLSSMNAEDVASLHQTLVWHSLDTAVRSNIGPVELWCAPSVDHPFFIECAKNFRVELHSQTEGGLGRRMADAFKKTLEKGDMAILIGTDCPSLSPEDLKEAVAFLSQGSQAVIGPAEDGGYVAIGLQQYDSSLFEGISWGTGAVLAETKQKLARLGWNWHELTEKWDVDRPEDVERLKRDGLGIKFLTMGGEKEDHHG
jgi:rSAM/selenodomain-associated transferase 1